MKNHSTPSTPPPPQSVRRFSLRHLRVKASLGMAGAITTLLVACGGGGDGEPEKPAAPVSRATPTPTPSPSPQPAASFIKATTSENVRVVSRTDAAVVEDVQTDAQKGSTTFTVPETAALAKAVKGQVLYMPPSAKTGFPFGFTGKVTSTRLTNGKTQVTMREAMVEDVFDKLDVDIDTSSEKMQIQGVLQAPGVMLNISPGEPLQAAGIQQSGKANKIEFDLCQTMMDAAGSRAGVDSEFGDKIPVRLTNGKYVLQLEGEASCKRKNGKPGMNYRLEATFGTIIDKEKDKDFRPFFATVDLRDAVFRFKAKYDKDDYKSRDGWALLSAQLEADYSYKSGLRSPKKLLKKSLSDILMPNASEMWDKNFKVKMGSFLELSGLDGDDKKGMLPLGGIVMSLPHAIASYGTASAIPFAGGLSATELQQYKAASIIIWLYLRADGTVSMVGETGVSLSQKIKKGFEFKVVRDALVATSVNEESEPLIKVPYFKGKVDVENTVGAALVADFLMAGVRPATMQLDLARYTQEINLTGEGAYIAKAPDNKTGWKLNGCYEESKKFESQFRIQARVKAEVKGLFVRYGQETAWNSDFKPIDWLDDKGKKNTGCLIAAKMPQIKKPDAVGFTDSSQKTIRMVFNMEEALKTMNPYTVGDKAVIDKWQVLATEVPKKFLAGTKRYPLTIKGKLGEVQLPYGKNYTLRVVAASDDYGDVAESKETDIVRLGTDTSLASISSVETVPATVSAGGGEYTLILNGSLLPIGKTMLQVDGCIGQKVPPANPATPLRKKQQSPTRHEYTCTAPNAAGKLPLTVLHSDGKKTLYSTSIDIAEETLLPLQYTLKDTAVEKEQYVFSVKKATGDKACYVKADFDWGDGKQETGTPLLNRKCLTILGRSHTYGQPGSYTITAVHTTAAGNIVRKTHTVEVKELPLPALSYSLPATATAGAPYAYSIRQPQGDNTCYQSYSINWGDGKEDTDSKTGADCIALSSLPAHSYTTAGDYSMAVALTSKSGKTVRKTHSVKVAAQGGVTVLPSKINDTGITKCGTVASNKADCSTAVSNATGGQVPLGQDGHYGTGMNGSTGMVFEKVAGFEGKCVQDKHTGLMWEVKQSDGGLHDASHTYSWYSTTNNGGKAGKQNGGTCKGSNCDTAAFVAAVNAASWCGHSDWRLPTREELRSIVDYSRSSPAIDTAYFPHTNIKNSSTSGHVMIYWSSSPRAHHHYFVVNTDNAWGRSFAGGSDFYYPKSTGSYVRLVRGGQ